MLFRVYGLSFLINQNNSIKGRKEKSFNSSRTMVKIPKKSSVATAVTIKQRQFLHKLRSILTLEKCLCVFKKRISQLSTRIYLFYIRNHSRIHFLQTYFKRRICFLLKHITFFILRDSTKWKFLKSWTRPNRSSFLSSPPPPPMSN